MSQFYISILKKTQVSFRNEPFSDGIYFFECTKGIFKKLGRCNDKTSDNTFRRDVDNIKILM